MAEIIEEIFTLRGAQKSRRRIIEEYELRVQTGASGGAVLTMNHKGYEKGAWKRVLTLERSSVNRLAKALGDIDANYDPEEEKRRHALHPEEVRRACPRASEWVEG